MLTDRKRQQAANHYKKIMSILGIDLNSPHSKDTPVRVIKMLEEMTDGVNSKEPKAKMTTFSSVGDQLVIVAPIRFASMCAHHHVPFIGKAAVGYLPNKLILGLSKFKRVIDHYAARPQTQEDLVCEVADYLDKLLKPRALYVYMEAEHTCMSARGVRLHGAQTLTHAVRGKLALETGHLKDEFLTLTLPKMRGSND